jgi:hypothetical protein
VVTARARAFHHQFWLTFGSSGYVPTEVGAAEVAANDVEISVSDDDLAVVVNAVEAVGDAAAWDGDYVTDVG